MTGPEAWMIAGAELVEERGRAWVYRFANGRGIAVAAGAVAGLLVGKWDAAEIVEFLDGPGVNYRLARDVDGRFELAIGIDDDDLAELALSIRRKREAAGE